MLHIYFGALHQFKRMHLLVYFWGHSGGQSQVFRYVFKFVLLDGDSHSLCRRRCRKWNNQFQFKLGTRIRSESCPVRRFNFFKLPNSLIERNSSDIRFSRMNNVHIEIEPQAVFRDVLQTILKDSGQSLDKTAPTKFRNRKLPIVYIEAHINLEKASLIFNWQTYIDWLIFKFRERTGVLPPRAVFKQKKRPWDGNTSITANASLLKRSRLGLSNAIVNFFNVFTGPHAIL